MINKLKTAVLFLFLSFNIAVCYAQNGPIKVNYTINDDKSVSFTYENTDFGYYTIKLVLSRLTNTHISPEQTFTIGGSYGGLMTIKPDNKDQGIGFSYTYFYVRGKLNPKYNADFVYLLPYKKGSKTKVYESEFVGTMYFGKTAPDDWKAYRFYTKDEDTVTAVRKGIVVEVKDLYGGETAANIAYKSALNVITVEHADGTYARYEGLKQGSIVVKPGQLVYPGTVLGVNTKYTVASQYSLCLIITYRKYVTADDIPNKGANTSNSINGFITPHFYTAENANTVLAVKQEYTSDNTPEIIKKEFTKKELKL